MCFVSFSWAARGTRYFTMHLLFSRLKRYRVQSSDRCIISAQVHKMLAEFRLIPGLNNLFDKLIWRKYTASNHVVHGQNENCDCSPV